MLSRRSETSIRQIAKPSKTYYSFSDENTSKPESQATAKHKWHRLVFDPNTMKLPDFLEELNQGAEKAFGEHAQKMIDSLLYAKLPPKLKRSVNMARLKNGSYDEIVAHLEKELELNALEESDDLPMATMTSSSAKPKTPLSTGQLSDITCNYCREKGHMVKDCEKLKNKKEKDAQQGKSTQKKTYLECGTCGKKNHPEERCWQGAGAHLKPKRTRPEDPNDNKPNSKAQKPQTKNHHQGPNPHLPMMSQKTNFATTPIQRTNIRPAIHQIGPSNANFSSIQSAIDGLSLCCLAAADGQSHHHYLQQYPFVPETNSCLES